MTLKANTCRVCGCTEEKPCIFSDDPYPGSAHDAFNLGGDDGGDLTCAWMDIDRTLCTNPRCIALTPLAVLIEMSQPRTVLLEGTLLRCSQ